MLVYCRRLVSVLVYCSSAAPQTYSALVGRVVVFARRPNRFTSFIVAEIRSVQLHTIDSRRPRYVFIVTACPLRMSQDAPRCYTSLPTARKGGGPHPHLFIT